MFPLIQLILCNRLNKFGIFFVLYIVIIKWRIYKLGVIVLEKWDIYGIKCWEKQEMLLAILVRYSVILFKQFLILVATQ